MQDPRSQFLHAPIYTCAHDLDPTVANHPDRTGTQLLIWTAQDTSDGERSSSPPDARARQRRPPTRRNITGDHQSYAEVAQTTNREMLHVARDQVNASRTSYRGIARRRDPPTMTCGTAAILYPRRAIGGRSVFDSTSPRLRWLPDGLRKSLTRSKIRVAARN
jgi:hypothetical protein